MARFGLNLGQSYVSQSPNADAERCENLYTENIEGSGKSQTVLYSTPGLKVQYQLAGPSIRGLFEFNGRCFAVSGTKFYELIADGTTANVNPVASDNTMVSFTAGPNQILIASAGVMYVFNLTANTLTPVNPSTYVGPVLQVAYSDGFFLALFKNSGEWQVSSPDDATTWSLLDVAIVSVFPDNVNALMVGFREPFLLGNKQTVAYFDAGAAIFPFQVNPSAFIETGCIAPFSVAKMNNTGFWLGGDDRGSGVVWTLSGYTPQRISTHALELAMQGYAQISDAVAYTYQDQGHQFYVLYFPTPSKTWVFDAATSLWHERNFLSAGVKTAHRSQCHAFNFGMHLVGDWNSGNVYQMAINLYQDFGNAIQRERICPLVGTELTPMQFQRVELDIETGLGPTPPLRDGYDEPRDPQVWMSYSNDGGHTYSNEQMRGFGQAGDFSKRVHWDRLGRSARKGRVFKFKITDPVPVRIIDGYVDATGYQPSERIATQLRKVS